MRPSRINRSIASRAISRRTGSKPESTTAFGVSSMRTVIPVAASNARIFLPSRPMMRPFMSSPVNATVAVEISTETVRNRNAPVAAAVRAAAAERGPRPGAVLPVLRSRLSACRSVLRWMASDCWRIRGVYRWRRRSSRHRVARRGGTAQTGRARVSRKADCSSPVTPAVWVTDCVARPMSASSRSSASEIVGRAASPARAARRSVMSGAALCVRRSSRLPAWRSHGWAARGIADRRLDIFEHQGGFTALSRQDRPPRADGLALVVEQYDLRDRAGPACRPRTARRRRPPGGAA